ncbi:hypothetical protein KUL25_06225 [Rhodobacteraceae bacterium N5(2021)]|uniref:Uncharacterized protein n=1 Tax=Gymnodinialimonas phycosphaerae TaxID=2841589 RepID=A0A975YH71_9RHOB|nr:hypothetical protein [Gymnodinialimonas phycosphaerae]MBY4892356.1 hypothetical protein [Gymnodinialimonas phycosphaerae]
MTGPLEDPSPGMLQTVVSPDPAIDDRGVVRGIESDGQVRGLFGLQSKDGKERSTFLRRNDAVALICGERWLWVREKFLPDFHETLTDRAPRLT